MQKSKKLQILYLALTILLGTILSITSYFYLFSCGDTFLSKTLSPNSNFLALIYQRNCGATTGYVRHIKIMTPTNYNFYKVLPNHLQGNYVSFLGSTEGLVLSVEEQGKISTTWSNHDTLVITCPKSTTKYIQEKKWNTIKIIYAKNQ